MRFLMEEGMEVIGEGGKYQSIRRCGICFASEQNTNEFAVDESMNNHSIAMNKMKCVCGFIAIQHCLMRIDININSRLNIKKGKDNGQTRRFHSISDHGSCQISPCSEANHASCSTIV